MQTRSGLFLLDGIPRAGNNEPVIRSVTAVMLAVALEAYALMGPLVHAHPDEHATEHHAAHAVHAHFSAHTSHHTVTTGPVIGDDDHDRPVYLQLYVAVGAQAATLLSTSITAFELPAPAEARAHRPVRIVHGLDPPLSRLLPSRAPPAFLS